MLVTSAFASVCVCTGGVVVLAEMVTFGVKVDDGGGGGGSVIECDDVVVGGGGGGTVIDVLETGGGGSVLFVTGGGTTTVGETGGLVTVSDGGSSLVCGGGVEIGPVPEGVISGMVTSGEGVVSGAFVSVAFWRGGSRLVTTDTIWLATDEMGWSGFFSVALGGVVGSAWWLVDSETTPVGAITMGVELDDDHVDVGATETIESNVAEIVEFECALPGSGTVGTGLPAVGSAGTSVGLIVGSVGEAVPPTSGTPTEIVWSVGELEGSTGGVGVIGSSFDLSVVSGIVPFAKGFGVGATNTVLWTTTVVTFTSVSVGGSRLMGRLPSTSSLLVDKVVVDLAELGEGDPDVMVTLVNCRLMCRG
jgi:hypothetical protein